MSTTTYTSTCTTCSATFTDTVEVPASYWEAGRTVQIPLTACRECRPFFVVADGYRHCFDDILDAARFAGLFPRAVVDAR
jgi:hypothetical protein